MKPIKYTSVVFILFILTLQANAQQKVWDDFGKPKSAVIDTEKAKSAGYKVTVKENSVCTELIPSLTNCKIFDDGIFSEYWIISDPDNIKDYAKDIVSAKRKYGNPISYMADYTEVNTIKQAIGLAEDRVAVKFNDKSENIFRTIELILTEGRPSKIIHIVKPNDNFKYKNN